MKFFNAAAIAVAAAMSLSAVALADVPADTQDALKALMQTQCKSLQSGDYEAYTKTMADDFKETDVAGKSMTRDQSVDNYKKQVAAFNLKVTNCDFTIKGATGDANSVTLDVLSATDGTVEQQGQTIQVHVDSRESQTWVKSGDAWVEKSANEKGHVIKAGDQVIDQAGSINR